MRAIWTVVCIGAFVEICGCCGGGAAGTSGASTSAGSLATSNGASGSSTGGESTGTTQGSTSSRRTSAGSSSGTTGETSGSTSAGSSTGRCPAPSGVGGSCVTTVDCQDGLICTSDHGGGTCIEESATQVAACAAGGSGCGKAGDAACCGFCRNSLCVDISAAPCASYPGAPCNSASDCCVNLACVSDAGQQTCQPSCGQENSACDPAHADADCCVALGLTCRPYADTDGGPFECANSYDVAPGGGCASACSENGPPECQLGSSCDPRVQPDNCVAAGLYCDTSYDVCEGPQELDLCTPHGPACGSDTTLTNSRVSLVCTSTMFTTGPVCAQLCESTSDCLDPEDACCLDCSPPVCVPGFLENACSDYFGPCNAQGKNDGFCVPYNFEGTLTGACSQATRAGGGPGSACTPYANRENPAFCDESDVCVTGFCAPFCNSGTAPDHKCPGGEGQICVPEYGQTTDSEDFGLCYTKCDFLSDAGCAAPGGGLPQVCVPGLLYGLGDTNMGVCAAQVANPAPLGAPCSEFNGIYVTPSPCVAGATCYNNPSGGNACDQFCLLGDKCPGGSDCKPINLSVGLNSSVVGLCY